MSRLHGIQSSSNRGRSGSYENQTRLEEFVNVSIPYGLVEFDPDPRERWRGGYALDCSDPYCQSLARRSGTCGFGDFVVGRHFADLGWARIRHDYSFIAANNRGKWPKSEALMEDMIGTRKLRVMRSLGRQFPDQFKEHYLFMHKSGLTEVPFVE